MYGLYDNYGGWGAGGMMGSFWGGFMMIVFWVLIALLIMWLIREARGNGLQSGLKALDILKERYAKGEISKEEFETKKKDIS